MIYDWSPDPHNWMLFRSDEVSDKRESKSLDCFHLLISLRRHSSNGLILTAEVSKCSRARRWNGISGRKLPRIDTVNELSKVEGMEG